MTEITIYGATDVERRVGLPSEWSDFVHPSDVETTPTRPVHTIGGEPIGPENPGEYGRTHDFKCPACVEGGSSFTTSPRSETYWSS